MENIEKNQNLFTGLEALGMSGQADVPRIWLFGMST
jgi:hypothetical protein